MRDLVTGLPGRITSSFWFVPLLLTLAGGFGGVLAINFDETALARRLAGTDVILAITVDGGRSLVSTVAGGIVTMASLVFSLTFVALTLMSQQLGPRLIQIFIRDQFAKLTFGVFIGAFVFCLVVLVVTGTGSKGNFVPVFSLMLVIALAIVSFCLMIMYINHIATSIQADTLIVRLGENLTDAFDRLSETNAGPALQSLPPKSRDKDELDIVRKRLKDGKVEVCARDTGYVASIDFERILTVLQDHDLYARMLCRPGHFLADDVAVLAIARPEGALPKEVEEELREAIGLERVRSVSETGEFEMNALIEVALRALSPGLNDSYTALACIDQLTAALAHYCKTQHEPMVQYDADGNPRLQLYVQDFDHFLNAAFHPIRHAARDNPLVLGRLINGYRLLASLASAQSGSGDIIDTHLRALEETIRSNVSTADDRAHLLDLLDRVWRKEKSVDDQEPNTVSGV